MTRPLPTLDLVRGFDAAARHLSFTKAASELFLTQSAVSRQIKTLEDQLGVALFQRRHRALVLTEPGRHFHQAATDALRLLHDAAVRIRGGGGRRLTLSATIGFSSLWLIPRLNDFRARFPDIDIRIDANNRFVDLAREEVDVAIRYCTPDLAPPGAQRLFGEQVIVVCCPALAREPGLATPADLARHVLLHYDRPDGIAPWSSWEVWLEVQGVPGLKPTGSVVFTGFDLLMQAALNGQGVALAPTPLVRRLIADRKLVAPLKAVTGSARAYHLLLDPSAAARPPVREFVAWMLEQAAEEERAGAQQFYGAKAAVEKVVARRAGAGKVAASKSAAGKVATSKAATGTGAARSGHPSRAARRPR